VLSKKSRYTPSRNQQSKSVSTGVVFVDFEPDSDFDAFKPVFMAGFARSPDKVNATMGKVNARPRAEVH